MYFGLHVNNLYSCKILLRLIFSTDFFKKYPNIKFHDNPFSGSRVIPCGQTEGQIYGQTERRKRRHDEVNGRFSQFCERV